DAYAPSGDRPLWDELVLLILYYGHSSFLWDNLDRTHPRTVKDKKDELIPFMSAIVQAITRLLFFRTSISLAFSTADNAEEMTTTPVAYLMDRSAIRILILVGFSLEIPDRRKRYCGIRLILAPKSASVFFTAKGSIRHGSVKLPGSPSFWGKFLWMIEEHSSLSLTKKASFLSFSLWERRTSISLDFSMADNAEEMTTVSWLFSWRKAYSRCSHNSFSSSLAGSMLEGFNRFSEAFHSSGSTGSFLG
nr:hypothetical protein [Tanacetum cinerariifolium]